MNGLNFWFLIVLVQTSIGLATVPDDFASELRCPFAKVWLEHGPERAARMLGVDTPHRRLDDVTWGTCTYTNPFAGGLATCVEMRGTQWTDSTAAAKCSSIMPGSPGTTAKGEYCAISGTSAGWCSTEGGTLMALSGLAGSCDATAKACTTYSAGAFSGIGQCATSTPPTIFNANSSSGNLTRCIIAPGPMGAAHQLAQSPGYDSDCVGTPGESSPYMWPLRWSAKVDSKSLGFSSDKVQYESRGQVWYMLDKNWKRLDIWFQSGVQRTVGQAPCPNSSTDPFSCDRNSDRNRTILHRGSKMVFIDYEKNGTISNCTQLDLGPIGNVRPDWFMDKRGATTSVQYLGDSHVYYLGEPRLVKQWRKKDFADQYFTMSMARLPDANGTHWPLILNVPGEGFGDDFLQHWYEHRHLDDADEAAFFIDTNFVANGGRCFNIDGSGAGGPPTGQQAHIPSNLQLDKMSWREIEWTGSPVWAPTEPEGNSKQGGWVTITDGVQQQSCFDEKSSTVQVSIDITLEKAVWVAVGFRDTEECLMTPRGGGNGEVLVALPGTDGGYTLSHGPLSPALKSFNAGGVEAFLAVVTPIGKLPDLYIGGSVELSGGNFMMAFKRKYKVQPKQLNLTFALGSSASFGYHTNRACFIVNDLPACAPVVYPTSGVQLSSTGAPRTENSTQGGWVTTTTTSGVQLSGPGAPRTEASSSSRVVDIQSMLAFAFVAVAWATMWL